MLLKLWCVVLGAAVMPAPGRGHCGHRSCGNLPIGLARTSPGTLARDDLASFENLAAPDTPRFASLYGTAKAGDPDRALSAMQAVQTTGREALGEMARLLGMLREDGGEIGLAPAPGLADLTTLVDGARRSGIDVHLQLDGYPRQLPPGPELSIYRIVQEALTNIRKHAGRSRAAVRVTCSDTAIVAEIDNDGAGEPLADPTVPGAGHGLIGMRERVALYGGTLVAGPSAAGGFQVRADIPLTDQP